MYARIRQPVVHGSWLISKFQLPLYRELIYPTHCVIVLFCRSWSYLLAGPGLWNFPHWNILLHCNLNGVVCLLPPLRNISVVSHDQTHVGATLIHVPIVMRQSLSIHQRRWDVLNKNGKQTRTSNNIEKYHHIKDLSSDKRAADCNLI
jgi:hypothetical protein